MDVNLKEYSDLEDGDYKIGYSIETDRRIRICSWRIAAENAKYYITYNGILLQKSRVFFDLKQVMKLFKMAVAQHIDELQREIKCLREQRKRNPVPEIQ